MKIGPLWNANVPFLRIQDLRAEDVGREQVGRELHARERDVERARERLRERGLADTGHVLDEDVTCAEQAHQEEIDDVVLALDDGAKGLAKRESVARVVRGPSFSAGSWGERRVRRGRPTWREYRIEWPRFAFRPTLTMVMVFELGRGVFARFSAFSARRARWRSARSSAARSASVGSERDPDEAGRALASAEGRRQACAGRRRAATFTRRRSSSCASRRWDRRPTSRTASSFRCRMHRTGRACASSRCRASWAFVTASRITRSSRAS